MWACGFVGFRKGEHARQLDGLGRRVTSGLSKCMVIIVGGTLHSVACSSSFSSRIASSEPASINFAGAVLSSSSI